MDHDNNANTAKVKRSWLDVEHVLCWLNPSFTLTAGTAVTVKLEQNYTDPKPNPPTNFRAWGYGYPRIKFDLPKDQPGPWTPDQRITGYEVVRSNSGTVPAGGIMIGQNGWRLMTQTSSSNPIYFDGNTTSGVRFYSFRTHTAAGTSPWSEVVQINVREHDPDYEITAIPGRVEGILHHGHITAPYKPIGDHDKIRFTLEGGKTYRFIHGVVEDLPTDDPSIVNGYSWIPVTDPYLHRIGEGDTALAKPASCCGNADRSFTYTVPDDEGGRYVIDMGPTGLDMSGYYVDEVWPPDVNYSYRAPKAGPGMSGAGMYWVEVKEVP